MKSCSKCGQAKPLDEFYKHPGGESGRRGDCKLCILAARRERYVHDGEVLRARVRRYQEQNAAKVLAYRRTDRAKAATRRHTRRRYLGQTYGLTLDEFDVMFAAQGECCAVCRSDGPPSSFVRGHDHLTGEVRGILCWHCNIGLGHFRDDVHNLVAAADYLIRSLDARKVG